MRRLEEIFGCEPHLVDPKSGYRVWFTEPVGYAGEIGADQASLDDGAADFICDVLSTELRKRNPADAPYFIIHDWSATKNYSQYARKRLLDNVRANRGKVRDCGIVASHSNAFARAAAATDAAALRMIGFHLHIATDIGELVAKFGLTAASKAP